MGDPEETLRLFLRELVSNSVVSGNQNSANQDNHSKGDRYGSRDSVNQVPRVLIAVSGGSDSMALLAAAQELAKPGEIRLQAAHLIHHPDSKEALARADLVRQYCATTEIPVTIERIKTPHRRLGSPEERLRLRRYEFLSRIAQKTECDWIWTGHHADDQVETLLMRIFAGTGLRGLSGIPKQRGQYGRPFLSLPKADLIHYCKKRRIPYAEDPTNQDLTNPRNRVRHQVLPLLEATFNPAVRVALLRLGRWAEEGQEVIAAEVERCWDSCLVQCKPQGGAFSKAKIVLDIEAILSYFIMIQKYTLLKAVALITGHPVEIPAHRWDGIIALLKDKPTGSRQILPGGIQLVRAGQQLIISSGETITGAWQIWPGKNRTLAELGWKAVWTKNPATPRASGKGEVADLTLSDSTAPLLLRPAKRGDRFFPLGAPGEKSLYRFLTDQKVSRIDKSNTLVLECKGEILWVVGHRISERAKLVDTGAHPWRLSLTPLS